MATDYAKRKNDDLIALLKDRNLPHTGKKADFVKRLEDYDAAHPTTTATTTTTTAKPALEDEIDWDDDPALSTAKEATTAPAADALAAGGVGVEVPNPTAVPNQVVVEDPAQTDDLTVAAAPVVEEVKVEEKDFSTGLAERTIDEEIEKRKARARKFGQPEDTDDIKALERAKRFGATDLPGLLNKALPSETRKRGRDGEGGGGDGGIRKRSRGPQRGGRGGGRRGGGPRRERSGTPGKVGGGGGGAGWMNDADREAAERRKARFAGTG